MFNAFRSPSGALNLSSLKLLFSSTTRSYFIGSFQLCLISSAVGAVLGAILAYAIASGNPDGATVLAATTSRSLGCWPSSAASRWRSRSWC